MAEPAFSVLFEMVSMVISNTVGTLGGLAGLFGEFMQSMGIVMGSGFGGFVLGLLVIFIVLFFLVKFVFSSGKTIIMLVAVATLLLFLIFLGMSIF